MKRYTLAIAAAALVVLGVGCTPEQIKQAQRAAERVTASEADAPAAAVRVPLAPTVVDVQMVTATPYSASVSCDPLTLHLTNTGIDWASFNVIYGPEQQSLVAWVMPSEDLGHAMLPSLAAGGSVDVPLSSAVGHLVTGFVDNGILFTIDAADC